jgi:hypothetical protein
MGRSLIPEGWPPQTRSLHDPLDRRIPLVAAADEADVAQALLERRRLGDDAPEPEEATGQRLRPP